MTAPTPHPLEVTTAFELRRIAGELQMQVEEGVRLGQGAPGELQTMAVHASTLLMRADLADLRAEIEKMNPATPTRAPVLAFGPEEAPPRAGL